MPNAADTKNRDIVLVREGYECLATGAPDPEVTHIVHRFSLGSSRNSDTARERFAFAGLLSGADPGALVADIDDYVCRLMED